MALWGRCFPRPASGDVAPYIDCGLERARLSGDPGGEATIILRKPTRGGSEVVRFDQNCKTMRTAAERLSCTANSVRSNVP
jgi:hypothetical protein